MKSLKLLFHNAFAYMALGVASGLFYREFTKGNDFGEGEFTQLAVVHTHLLTLGFVVLLIVLALEKLFGLSRSRLFGWFLWIYNAGIVLTAGAMVWHGMLTVLGEPSSAMIAGIAGLGHMLLTAALVLLFLAMRRVISAAGADTSPPADISAA